MTGFVVGRGSRGAVWSCDGFDSAVIVIVSDTAVKVYGVCKQF
ncbi:hypothetical protein QTL86_22720 [Cellulosilyticum sp. ST5]|nr:hypothetical protein [Cellulosilyticum sp. WCF-2]